jgi:uncharacterized membrane protein YphA (DoxX/SURF4 family)
MNVLLWIIQIVLGLFSIAGGAYKILQFDEIANMPQTRGIPHAGWIALGVFEIVCGLLLLVPAFKRRLTPLAAVALAVESIALAIYYARYSLVMAATNPLVWVVGMAVLALIVAWGRYALRAQTR